MTKQWYLPRELTGLPGMPAYANSIRRMGADGRLKRRKRQLGKGWEYHADSLPDATRDALLLAGSGAADATTEAVPVLRIEIVVRIAKDGEQ